MGYDDALMALASLLPQLGSNPSVRAQLLSLDFSYSAIIRVVYEEVTTKYNAEEGEMEEEENSSSMRTRLRACCPDTPLDISLTWSLDSALPEVSLPHLHFYYRMVNTADGLTFTVLPSYQSLVISDMVEVTIICHSHIAYPYSFQTFVVICKSVHSES